jgi:hypothetical protein
MRLGNLKTPATLHSHAAQAVTLQSKKVGVGEGPFVDESAAAAGAALALRSTHFAAGITATGQM